MIKRKTVSQKTSRTECFKVYEQDLLTALKMAKLTWKSLVNIIASFPQVGLIPPFWKFPWNFICNYPRSSFFTALFCNTRLFPRHVSRKILIYLMSPTLPLNLSKTKNLMSDLCSPQQAYNRCSQKKKKVNYPLISVYGSLIFMMFNSQLSPKWLTTNSRYAYYTSFLQTRNRR